MHIPQTFPAPASVEPTKAWLDKLVEALQKEHRRLARVLNSHVSFGNPTVNNIDQPHGLDNMDGVWISNKVTPIGAATDFTVTHNLGRIPVGYMTMRTQKGSVIFDGTNLGTDWTKTTMVLRCTLVSDTVTLFII